MGNILLCKNYVKCLYFLGDAIIIIVTIIIINIIYIISVIIIISE